MPLALALPWLCLGFGFGFAFAFGFALAFAFAFGFGFGFGFRALFSLYLTSVFALVFNFRLSLRLNQMPYMVGGVHMTKCSALC